MLDQTPRPRISCLDCVESSWKAPPPGTCVEITLSCELFSHLRKESDLIRKYVLQAAHSYAHQFHKSHFLSRCTRDVHPTEFFIHGFSPYHHSCCHQDFAFHHFSCLNHHVSCLNPKFLMVKSAFFRVKSPFFMVFRHQLVQHSTGSTGLSQPNRNFQVPEMRFDLRPSSSYSNSLFSRFKQRELDIMGMYMYIYTIIHIYNYIYIQFYRYIYI